MDKSLNTDMIVSAMERAGFSQADLAAELNVSREAVSKWLSGSKFPRPRKLLDLALLLDINFDELVRQGTMVHEPVVAYRKRAGTKTTDKHIEKARSMGRLLEPLVTYLPFDRFLGPATLKDPNTDYDYVQGLVMELRKELDLSGEDVLEYVDLINKFRELQAVLIPVFWGDRKNHSNALHIYLPGTNTTWIYLNLDVHMHDFKFWMAHELGHVLAPNLSSNDGEEFADCFAGALLFPDAAAGKAYRKIIKKTDPEEQISIIEGFAEDYAISLITVYNQVNAYAEFHKLKKIELGKKLYAWNTTFNKQFLKLSETIFNKRTPTPNLYIKSCKKIFNTPFFDVLKTYLAESGKSPGYVQAVLDTPLLDAKGIHAELA